MERGSIIIWISILSIATSPVYSQYYSKPEPYASKPEKITHLHFFFHDTMSGRDPSAVLVARGANISSDDYWGNAPPPFSSVLAIDDPLTVGPERTSEVIGSAQGLWMSSGKDSPCLLAFFDLGFTKGDFNGSSISVFSRNPILEAEREVAVVGGRGKFSMARGVARLKTFFLDYATGDAIVEYNVTVIHY